MYFIRHKTADRSADHFQSILIDDAVHADCGSRQHVDLIQKWNKVSQSAVNAVYNETVQSNSPDIDIFQCLDHTAECSLGTVLLLPVFAGAFFIVGYKNETENSGTSGNCG